MCGRHRLRGQATQASAGISCGSMSGSVWHSVSLRCCLSLVWRNCRGCSGHLTSCSAMLSRGCFALHLLCMPASWSGGGGSLRSGSSVGAGRCGAGCGPFGGGFLVVFCLCVRGTWFESDGRGGCSVAPSLGDVLGGGRVPSSRPGCALVAARPHQAVAGRPSGALRAWAEYTVLVSAWPRLSATCSI